MKITEIFDVQNSDSNLILGTNAYVLINDYENYNNRLHDHSTTLELLTQKALNLSLFRTFSPKLKISKASYPTKNQKLKQVQKTNFDGVLSSELLIIKKLLLINLRSFKIMQKLFQENKELQVLLKQSRNFSKKQKQKIEYVQNENESLKKTETHLKKRLESFIRQLNRASKSFIAGFADDCHDNFDNEVTLKDGKSDCHRDLQKLELAFNLSTNIAYRLHNESNEFLKVNNLYQEMSFCYSIGSQNLKIRLCPEIIEIPTNNIFDRFNDMYRDRQIEYPLLTWQKSDLKKPPTKSNECNYKIEKDLQNAIRLHSVNSSVWKSFLVLKTIHEFVMFNQVCELMKAFVAAGEACENEEMNPEADKTFSNRENSELYSFESEGISKITSKISLTLNEVQVVEASNEKVEHCKKKRLKKIKVFYRLKKINIKLFNSASINKKSKRKILEQRSHSAEHKSISIGVGDSCIISVDQESQVDDNFFVEFELATDYDESRDDLRNDELDDEDSSTKALCSSRKDFKQSLKSLEEIIRSVQLRSDQDSSMALIREKPRKKQFYNNVYNEEKNTKTQRKTDAKNKDGKKKKRDSFDYYKKEYYRKDNCKMPELPEMRKMYQIILENRLSQGVSFEYSTPEKSKVQLLFVSKSRDKRDRML